MERDQRNRNQRARLPGAQWYISKDISRTNFINYREHEESMFEAVARGSDGKMMTAPGSEHEGFAGMFIWDSLTVDRDELKQVLRNVGLQEEQINPEELAPKPLVTK